MKITDIIQNINRKLAGENLSYAELEVHLDSVIDDINAKLNSMYPAFSEFSALKDDDTRVYLQYPDYNLFPDRWVRTVVIPGAVYKWYVMDEEGIDTAATYGREYNTALFTMLRDFSVQVPDTFRVANAGYIQTAAYNPGISFRDPINNVTVRNHSPKETTATVVTINPYSV